MQQGPIVKFDTKNKTDYISPRDPTNTVSINQAPHFPAKQEDMSPPNPTQGIWKHNTWPWLQFPRLSDPTGLPHHHLFPQQR